MGCGGYSKINKPDVNGAVYRKITKEEIRVEIGNQVKVNTDGPVIVFVYGKFRTWYEYYIYKLKNYSSSRAMTTFNIYKSKC